MNLPDPHPSRLVMAIKIGNKLTRKYKDYENALENEMPITLFTKQIVDALCDLDVGVIWKKLAKKEPIFVLIDNVEKIHEPM